MLTRIVTAIIAIIIGVIILFLSDTIVLYIAVSAISGLIIYELFHAKDFLKYKTSFAVCLAFSVLLPFFYLKETSSFLGIFVFLLALILFITLIMQHNDMTFDNVSFMICTTLSVSFSMCTLILIKNNNGSDGIFYLIIALASAWFTDAGAYFIGTFFGKKKLCPNISPKKTVEGAIGGLIVNCIVIIIAAVVYNCFFSESGANREINYILILIYGAVSAVISVIGDLAASLLKRQCQIKDFGNILPGHGGMMDRFDSVLFVAPFTYLILKFSLFFY